MPESISYQSILIISVLAFATPIVINSFQKVKVPYVVGEIIVGLIVGKSFLNVVQDDSWLLFLSNLGLAYLMFSSGLEIDIDKFRLKGGGKESGKGILVAGTMFLISLLVSFGISSVLFRFGFIGSVLFFTFLLPATAPGLLVPFFKERDLLDTNFGQELLLFSLLCEFLCLIAITFVSSGISEGVSYRSFLFIVVIAVAVLLYWIGRRVISGNRFSIDNFKGLHMEVRASFAVVIILVAISHAVGAEIVFGSFIAGIIFSIISGRARDDLKEKVDIIGYGFLVPIFFIEIGVNIDIKDVFYNPVLLLAIPVILLVFYVVKLLPSLLYIRQFGVKRAVSASFLLSAQLSLMIVGLQIARSLGIIGETYYSVFVFAVIISCLLFPALFHKTFSDEGLSRKRRPALDRICMREIILTNEESCDKPLRDIEFPSGCRVFMIMRDGEEILPDGDTVMQMGDILLVAGIKAHEDEMIGLIGC